MIYLNNKSSVDVNYVFVKVDASFVTQGQKAFQVLKIRYLSTSSLDYYSTYCLETLKDYLMPRPFRKQLGLYALLMCNYAAPWQGEQLAG